MASILSRPRCVYMCFVWETTHALRSVFTTDSIVPIPYIYVVQTLWRPYLVLKLVQSVWYIAGWCFLSWTMPISTYIAKYIKPIIYTTLHCWYIDQCPGEMWFDSNIHYDHFSSSFGCKIRFLQNFISSGIHGHSLKSRHWGANGNDFRTSNVGFSAIRRNAWRCPLYIFFHYSFDYYGFAAQTALLEYSLRSL